MTKMAKTPNGYELDHVWRDAPRLRFWQALEVSAPRAWGELDELARGWAEKMSARDIDGIKTSPYAGVSGTLRISDSAAREVAAMAGRAHLPEAGRLSPEFVAARDSWQGRFNLTTSWLTRLADLYILQAHTEIEIYALSGSAIPNFAVIGPHPAPTPDDFENAQTYKQWQRDTFYPHWHMTKVERIEAAHFFDWAVLYQCEAMSHLAIATKYRDDPGFSKLEAPHVKYGVDRVLERILLEPRENLYN